jgi:hypothetical protein
MKKLTKMAGQAPAVDLDAPLAARSAAIEAARAKLAPTTAPATRAAD